VISLAPGTKVFLACHPVDLLILKIFVIPGR